MEIGREIAQRKSTSSSSSIISKALSHLTLPASMQPKSSFHNAIGAGTIEDVDETRRQVAEERNLQSLRAAMQPQHVYTRGSLVEHLHGLFVSDTRQLCKNVVESPAFECIMALLVSISAIFEGARTEVELSLPKGDVPAPFRIVQ